MSLKLKSPYLTLLTGLVLAAVLLVLSMTAAAKDSAGQKAAGTPSTPPASPSPSPSPTPSKPAVLTQAAYAGAITNGGGATIAIAVKEGKAVAYLCDGRRVEAWLRGTATDGKLALTGTGNARLTGTYGAVSAGEVVAAGRQWAFNTPAVKAPSGLYRATATVRGAKIVGGWIVLPDGRQVGIVTSDGAAETAPRLDPTSRTATVNGTQVTAAPQDGSGF